MRVLVTGGTGYLGGRIATGFRDAGHRVILFVRDVARAEARLGREFEYVRGDLAGGSGLAPALRDADAVVHTAAVVKNWSRHPEEFEQVNVAGSWALCEAALEARVSVFLYTASFFALGPSPDGRPVDETALDAPPPARFFNDYHSTKFRAARLLKAFVPRGLPLVTVIPTVLFGPGAETDGNHVGKILRWLQQGRFPGLIGDGRQRWNLAYIDDVVAGHLMALERGRAGQAYILGGEDRVLSELTERAAAALGVKAPERRVPFSLGHTLAEMESWKARLLKLPPLITHGEVDIYRYDWVYSSERAQAELDYRMTPFDEALARTIDWVKATAAP